MGWNLSRSAAVWSRTRKSSSSAVLSVPKSLKVPLLGRISSWPNLIMRANSSISLRACWPLDAADNGLAKNNLKPSSEDYEKNPGPPFHRVGYPYHFGRRCPQFLSGRRGQAGSRNGRTYADQSRSQTRFRQPFVAFGKRKTQRAVRGQSKRI